MELDYKSGGQISEATLDTNGDGNVNGADRSVAGMQLNAISSAPAILGGFGTADAPNSLENKYFNQSSGNMFRALESANALNNRRMSWRQIR
jgi:Tfp pilus tip-associated adhesin PilY1